jgi:predicted GIY-YIG superfamily endonuclease
MSDPHLRAHCIYNIPCECGRSYVGETGRPLSVRIGEHKLNLKNGLLDKSKLARHAFEEDHQISWNEAKILEIEVNGRQRKYKESAHVACMENPISQPSLEFPRIWIPLVKEEVNNLQRRSYL